MIKITDSLFLKTISSRDYNKVLSLMWEIYPPAYGDYWMDDCSWYLHKIYSQKNLDYELKQAGGSYCFICFRESKTHPLQTIGIFKTILNFKYTPLSHCAAFKVDRLYIHQKMQGLGVGKALMNYSEHTARDYQQDLIYLEAMDAQIQAQLFYKALGYVKSKGRYLDFQLLKDSHRRIWQLHKML